VDKNKLLQHLLLQLEATYQISIDAAERAHDTATSSENVAENKYDTLALEAAYLAHGQSLRALKCDEDIQRFKALSPTPTITEVTVGSLVTLLDQNEQQKCFFFGPSAGGLKVVINGVEVVVVTESSPLGKALLGKTLNDEVILNVVGKLSEYEIVNLS
jgi:transcription elongation GreA/GreB family factor